MICREYCWFLRAILKLARRPPTSTNIMTMTRPSAALVTLALATSSSKPSTSGPSRSSHRASMEGRMFELKATFASNSSYFSFKR